MPRTLQVNSPIRSIHLIYVTGLILIQNQYIHPYSDPRHSHANPVTNRLPLNLFCLEMANFGVINLLLQISLVYLLCNKNILASSFKVERNYQDTFQNPDCLTTEAKCSAKRCEHYNAGCSYRVCKSCQCGGMFETFSFIEGNDTGRCMDTKQMVNFPGKV
jgi:hypothetical protein